MERGDGEGAVGVGLDASYVREGPCEVRCWQRYCIGRRNLELLAFKAVTQGAR